MMNFTLGFLLGTVATIICVCWLLGVGEEEEKE